MGTGSFVNQPEGDKPKWLTLLGVGRREFGIAANLVADIVLT